MSDYIVLAILFTLEMLLFYFLPTLNGKDTLFGIVLKENDFSSEGLPILRKYRRDLLILAGAFICGFALSAFFAPKSMTFIYIFATVIVILLLFKYLRQTWQLRDNRTISKLATQLKPRRLRDFSNVWLEACVILLIIAPIVVLVFYYPSLPDVVPVHWNLAGEADGWEKKSIFSVFFPAIFGGFLQIFWIILKQDIVQARFRVPAENAEKILSLKEISLSANLGLIDWCRLIVGSLLATISFLLLSMLTALPVATALNVLIWTNIVLLILGIAFFIYRMILVNREVKALTGQIIFQTDDEAQGWNSSGLYYYNPNDTAFMLEKPNGIGYTLNFAHKRTLIYLALILSPVIFVLLDLVLTNK